MFCCRGMIHFLAHFGILDYSLHTLYNTISKWMLSVGPEMWMEYSPYSSSNNALFCRIPRAEGWYREGSVWKHFYGRFEEFRLIFQ